MRVKVAIISGVIIALLGGMTIVPSVGATSSFHFSNDVIAFTKKQGGMTAIWNATVYDHKVDVDNLHLGRGAHSPSWSPDGRQLVYVKDDHLYVSQGGRYHRPLPTTKGYSDGSPVWSPDGSKIAFVRTSTNGRQAIYTVAIRSAKTTNISGWSNDDNFRSPSWSPEEDKMVYEAYSGAAARLVIKDLKTNEQSTLTELSDVTALSEVSWSPNGKKILYKDSANETYTIWPDGSHRSVISDGDSYQASWSPSGDRMVFIEDPGEGSLSISEKDGTVVWLPIQIGEYDELAYPTWSPDEDEIAFTMIKDDDGARRSDLFMIDLKGDSTKPRLIAKGVQGRTSWR